MAPWLRDRWDLWRGIRRGVLLVVALTWSALSAFFQFRDNFVPARIRCALDTQAFIAHWGWRDWMIGFLVILVAASLEGCYRRHRQIVSEIEAKSPGAENFKVKAGRRTVKEIQDAYVRESPSVHEVRFNLPDSPLEHGWKVSYDPDKARVRYLTEPAVPGSLRLEVEDDPRFAIHHQLPPYARLCETVKLIAKYTNNTMVLFGLDVASGDKSKHRHVWIKYHAGDKPPAPTHGAPVPNPETELPEQTVYLVPELLVGDWMAFEISLPQSVQRTVGTQGWHYNSILEVRLRGTVSVAPIMFSNSRAAQSASQG